MSWAASWSKSLVSHCCQAGSWGDPPHALLCHMAVNWLFLTAHNHSSGSLSPIKDVSAFTAACLPCCSIVYTPGLQPGLCPLTASMLLSKLSAVC